MRSASSVAFLISKSNNIVLPDETFWCTSAPNESYLICDNLQRIIIRACLKIEFVAAAISCCNCRIFRELLMFGVSLQRILA